jgi:hypothetical protein
MMRKSRALGQALYREKKKRLGFTGAIPKTAALIMENLPDQFKTTSDGSAFLRYMDYSDEAKTKLLMVYISEHGRSVLERSEELYCDGTFNTAPPPFSQVCACFATWLVFRLL